MPEERGRKKKEESVGNVKRRAVPDGNRGRAAREDRSRSWERRAMAPTAVHLWHRLQQQFVLSARPMTAFEFGAVFRRSPSAMILLCAVLAGIGGVSSGATVYDQRQTGKTNVRVEVKDAVIVAVGDGELGGDYDYNYDYSDLTIKPGHPSSTPPSSTPTPQKPPSPKPTAAAPSASTSPGNFNLTQNAAIVLEAENNSIIFPASRPGNESSEPVKIAASDPHKPDQIPVLVLQEVHRPHKFLPVKTVDKEYVPSSRIRAKAPAVAPEDLPPRHCSPGFFLDNHNRCKRIRRPARERPQLPIGLRFEQKPAATR